MIAATELRLGNLFEYEGDVYSVGELSEDRINGFMFIADEGNPIPLTEEWLEWFGFGHVAERWRDDVPKEFQIPDSFWFLDLKGDVRQVRIRRRDSWGVSCGSMNPDHLLRYIKYVHELQNLLWEVGRFELPYVKN